MQLESPVYLAEGVVLSFVLFALSTSLPIYQYLTNNIDKRLLPLSLTCFTAGVYVFSASGLGSVLFSPNVDWQYLSSISLLFSPLGFYTFINFSFTNQALSKYTVCLEKINKTFVILSIIGTSANIWSYAVNVKLFVVLLAASFFVITFTLVKSLRDGNRDAETILIGTMAFFLLNFVFLLGQFFNIGNPSEFPIIWAALPLIFSLIKTLKTQPLSATNPQLALSLKDHLPQDKDTCKTAISAFAHDVNTPLGIGLLTISNLENDVEELHNLFCSGELKKSDLERHIQSCKEAIEIIASNLQTASDLVKTLRQNASNKRLTPQLFDVDTCFQQALSGLRPKILQSGHRLDYQCPKKITISSYPVILGQIITNLILNSLAHAYSPGITGCLRLAVSVSDTRLNIHYSDDGKGIDQRYIPQIFEPYFTTRSTSENCGLGLFIIHTLVTQQLRGTIDCHSKPNQGTTFIIDIPIERRYSSGMQPN